MERQATRHAHLAGRVFVGRHVELDILCAGLENALSGRGRFLLVVGEPGIGKTQLAEQLASQAGQAGAMVHWGRCWDGGGAPAYWPWIQIIRAHIQQLDAETLRAQLGAGAADIAQVVPEVAAHLPALEPPTPLSAEQARFRLFDSVSRFLANAASTRPQVLILDDLHTADVPSLLLLTFIAQDLPTMPALIVGAYRDVEATQDPAVDRALARLVREGHQLHLRGLEQAEIAGFIEDTTGIRAPSELVAEVYRITEGNPLFTAAVVDLLAREGRLERPDLPRWGRLAIPQEVRGAIRQRLDRLSVQAGHLLAQAAVMGREFDLTLLGRVAGLPPDLLEDAIAQALGWGILVESAQTPGQLAFSHDLVRRVLSTTLPFSERTALHRTIGHALEKLYGDTLDPPLAQVAHHFVHAARGGDEADVRRAIDYAQRAGDQAINQLAYEDAVGHYKQALGLLESAGVGETARLEVLVKLADAHHRSGDVSSGRQASRKAIEIARRLHAPEQLTRVVLGLVRVVSEAWTVDEAGVTLLEDALMLVDEGNPGLRAMLLAQLAIELYWSDADQRSGPLSLEALRLARQSGNPTALARALDARHHALWEPEYLAERMTIVGELISVAARARDTDVLIAGHRWRSTNLLEQGRIAEADQELEILARLAEDTRQPTARWYNLAVRARCAFMAGRLDETEQLAQAAYSIGSRLERRDALGIFTIQLFPVLRDQGRLAELESLLQRAVELYQGRLLWRMALANTYCHLGHVDSARREFEHVAADQFAGVPRAPERLVTLALLAEICAFLRDKPRAGQLYDLLLPYAESHVTGGSVVSLGAAARYLGLLARTMGEHRSAREHFEAALRFNLGMNALPWTVHTRYEYAQLLLDHGDAEDRLTAAELLESALERASALGMQPVADAVSACLETLRSKDARPLPAAPAGPPPAAAGMFRREGEYWAITYHDRPFLLKNLKGLGYLARLLAEPDREFHVLDLVRMEHPAPATRSRASQAGAAVDAGDAGELLDREAKAAYRRRLADLRQELDEIPDPGCAASLQTEIDFLAHELAAATGLGGRDRKAASAAERARLNVTHRIRAAVRKITAHDPDLGRHLDASVRTGTFCSYRPDPAARISWKL